MNAAAKVIITSHDRSARLARRYLKDGAAGYLTKPLDRDEFRFAVKRALRANGSGRREAHPSKSLHADAAKSRRDLHARMRDTENEAEFTATAPGETGQTEERVTRASTRTRRPRPDVLDHALAFFGFDGVGLSVGDMTEDCLVFEGCDGYVCVTVGDGSDMRNVNVEARRWCALVDVFLRSL